MHCHRQHENGQVCTIVTPTKIKKVETIGQRRSATMNTDTGLHENWPVCMHIPGRGPNTWLRLGKGGKLLLRSWLVQHFLEFPCAFYFTYFFVFIFSAGFEQTSIAVVRQRADPQRQCALFLSKEFWHSIHTMSHLRCRPNRWNGQFEKKRGGNFWTFLLKILFPVHVSINQLCTRFDLVAPDEQLCSAEERDAGAACMYSRD